MVDGIKNPTQQQIAERAYALYQERGAAAGFDVDDWLAAEKELSEGSAGESQAEPPQREKALAAAKKATA